MEHVIQRKNGQIEIAESPVPELNENRILVQNHYSLISAGTEGGNIKSSRKSLASKVKAKPVLLKTVVDDIQKKGPVKTYKSVKRKLNDFSLLGYSCVGQVVSVGDNVKKIRVGDYVACGGSTANHCEYVSVPQNLCVRLSITGKNNEDVQQQLQLAAYNTIGAIAMQGLRQADLKLGETCAVIGLGLIGQLTAILLRASGVKVIGLDIDREVVDIAGKHCADLSLIQDQPGCGREIHEYTKGRGCDAVIITAATNSLGPVNFAGRILRQKGRVVVVGLVPTGFEREQYYKKELELRMSCSYGPGRYDTTYEDKSIDYPYGYVRWTENRNMAAFQDLISTRRIDPSFLTTHVFPLKKATEAYDIIVNKSEPFLGVLLEYDVEKPLGNQKVMVIPSVKGAAVSLGFVGAGNYAQNYLLPQINTKKWGAGLKGVMTSSGTTAKSVAARFGFEFCTSDPADIINHNDINTVFICTRHDTHAKYVMDALNAGKHVFVEKPICIRKTELNEIQDCYNGKDQALTVGFNRRFSPLIRQLTSHIGRGTMSMCYRVNAGYIPSNSWVHDIDIGGGRVVGEVCHFIDLMSYVCGSLPNLVYASAVVDQEELWDNLIINLEFFNGSVGVISYFSNGADALPKEYFEVYKSGLTGVINDFESFDLYGKKKIVSRKLKAQDKGQRGMLDAFFSSVRKGLPSPVSFEDICVATETTFATMESIRHHKPVEILSVTT